MKKIGALTALAIALAGYCKITIADYTVIIHPDKKSIVFKDNIWRETTPLFIEWVDAPESNQYYRYNCNNWSPDAENIDDGKSFIQTATDCKGKQFAKMAKQEINTKTQEIRQVDTYIDETQEQILSNLIDTKDEIGTKKSYLKIINPVQGQNGIYQITDGKNGTFPAYVNMNDDGGNWILIARWTSSPYDTTTWNSFGVKGNPITTYTNNKTSYPVIPTGSVNDSNRMLVKSYGANWIASFGNWQSFNTFNNNTIIGASGIPANTSIGAKTLYIRANGWVGIHAQDMTSLVGLFASYGNTGPCGGANTVGSKPMCITYTGNATAHFDISSVKEFYIKSKN